MLTKSTSRSVDFHKNSPKYKSTNLKIGIETRIPFHKQFQYFMLNFVFFGHFHLFLKIIQFTVLYNMKILKMSSPSQIEHALYMFTRTFDQYKHESFLNLKTFTDGLPFSSMLSEIQYFGSTIEQMETNPQKWTQKLTNLKKLITKMESYVESQSQKRLKINDIQLVQIAKNSSQEQILKFFQVVIAVLMQTPQKQDYIQRIMDLDERSQQALVIIVQNAMQYRISQYQVEGPHQTSKSYDQLSNLQNQNHILTQQINELCQENQSLQKQNKQLKDKLHECQEEIQKARNLNIQMYMKNNDKSQSQRENSLIETLKKKMIDMSRQHEIQLNKYSDQNYNLKGKLIHYKEIQEELMERNKLVEDKLKNESMALDNQRKRQQKCAEEKDLKIKKLEYELQISKNKIRQLSQDIEVNDLNLRMELQKKQVRFKQLQKEVKNRLVEPSIQLGSKKFSNQEQKGPGKDQDHEQQMEYLKSQVQKLRNSNHQLERENLKMKKRSQKILAVQNQKKKLEKIILEVSKCRDSQIQMLVVSLYDLRNQNIKMHEIIKNLKWKQESKYE